MSLKADAADIFLKEGRIRIGWILGYLIGIGRRNATGAFNLGIWPVSVVVKLIARKHVVSADRMEILLEIAKGNLFEFSARWIIRNPSTISQGAESESLRSSLGPIVSKDKGGEYLCHNHK